MDTLTAVLEARVPRLSMTYEDTDSEDDCTPEIGATSPTDMMADPDELFVAFQIPIPVNIPTIPRFRIDPDLAQFELWRRLMSQAPAPERAWQIVTMMAKLCLPMGQLRRRGLVGGRREKVRSLRGYARTTIAEMLVIEGYEYAQYSLCTC